MQDRFPAGQERTGLDKAGTTGHVRSKKLNRGEDVTRNNQQKTLSNQKGLKKVRGFHAAHSKHTDIKCIGTEARAICRYSTSIDKY